MLRIGLLLIVLFTGASALAGEYNEVLSIGDAAPAWKDLPGVDGKTHSLAELDPSKLVVVCFMANSCDVARDYEERISAVAKKYADRVTLVAININRHADDSLEKMRERAEQKAYPFAYLRDESQQIGKDFGAGVTPEFFLLDRDRKVVYMGGMDDSSTASQVKTQYLEPAIAAVLSGQKPPTAETPPIGCRIPYPRSRR